MISITVTPSTLAHIDILAEAMRNLISCDDVKPQPKLVAITEPLVVEAPSEAHAPDPLAKAKAPKLVKLVKTAQAPETSPAQITLEEVRSKLSELSACGKTAEVKAILAEYGAFKLPDLAAEHFAVVLLKAGEL